MAMAEVGYQVRDSAAVLVGSEQTEPGDGWPYDRVLRALAKHPEMDARDLGALIVKEYLASYEADDGVTQSACDLSRADGLAAAVAALATQLTAALREPPLRQALLLARTRVQSYEISDNVDLGDLCGLLAGLAPGTAVAARCADVLRALGTGAPRGVGAYVLAQGSKGADLRDSRGVAIYFPTRAVSPLYARLDWARDTGWGGFLAAYLAAVRGRTERLGR
jgi:hypothetical protein